jgi:hypothetical protein
MRRYYVIILLAILGSTSSMRKLYASESSTNYRNISITIEKLSSINNFENI